MRKYILALTVTVARSASAKPIVWTKTDATAEGWAQDRYACERDVRMSAGSFGNIYVQDYNAQQFFNRCLQSKGYSPVQ
jgi:hypothetical protein